MTDREFITTKEIIIPKGTRIENWSNEDKENGTFSFVLGLDKDHVILPKLTESDIKELISIDFIKQKYTIEDLANGECAVINDGTLKQLKKVIKKAFPDSANCSPMGVDKYYYKSNSINFLWCSNNTTELPAQSVHDFLINEKKSEYNSNKEKIKIENFISKLSKNQAIEIIKNILNDMLDKDKNNN